ncbi:hypothetical protein Tco_0240609 [Tanacetum coccineum]
MIPKLYYLNIKLPILKKEEYDIWAMEMEHYLEYIDNEVWKVIQNGNSKKRISTGKDGVVRFYAIFHFFNQYSKKKFLLILKQMDINWKIAMIAIRLKKFYRENRKEMFAWMEKRCWIDKKSLYVSIVTTLVYFAKRMYIKGDTEGKKKRSTHSINIRSWESKCRNQMALMTMDDEIVNWREHP